MQRSNDPGARDDRCRLLLDLDGLRISTTATATWPAAALCRVGEVLQLFVGYRYRRALRGDEFAVCLPETGAATARLVADRIRIGLQRIVAAGHFSASIGWLPIRRTAKRLKPSSKQQTESCRV